MEPKDAESYRWNIFDMTKVWTHADHPLRPVGKLTLNRYPTNHFCDIEQAAFSPSTIVPGIAPSADPVLQARMFAYPDAAKYRLGVNYKFLPCNRPVSQVYNPYQRDGFMRFNSNYGGDLNYVNSSLKEMSFKDNVGTNGYGDSKHEELVGRIRGFTSEVVDDDFVQARILWDVFGQQKGQREAFVYNVSQHLKKADVRVQKQTIKMFSRANLELGKMIAHAVAVASHLGNGVDDEASI